LQAFVRRELDDARTPGVVDVLAIDDDEAIEKLRSVDAIVDTVGGQLATKLLAKVKQGGSFGYGSTLPDGAKAQHPAVKTMRVFARPDPSKVREFADDVRDGKFVLPIGGRMGLRDAAEAHVLGEKGGKAASGRSSCWRPRVQRIHARIANTRRDFLHQTSYAISKNHAMVVMEDLQVSNMSRSAAGSVKHSGRNVQQKTGLNPAILDRGWAEFRRQLEYKMICSGGQLIPVPPPRTSIACPRCGHISKENRNMQAQFACVECGFSENAHLVGAINILSLGVNIPTRAKSLSCA
jgi:predicted RNA-binding Zn-ribbon protein involved in translation (DUF1610 family)